MALECRHFGRVPKFRHPTPKLNLHFGLKDERKSITTDRMVFVPGPIEAVECVKDIYRIFIHERRTVYGIAQELNRRKVKFVGDSEFGLRRVSTNISSVL